MNSQKKNLYEVLGVKFNADILEIKSAYRELVKQCHPDAGGDSESILSINAAWEILKDPLTRKEYDRKNITQRSLLNEAQQRGERDAKASVIAKENHNRASASENELIHWFSKVYIPIDRLLGQIINPFQKQLHSLSADPYDDALMEVFCSYLNQSKRKLNQVYIIYRSTPIPKVAQGLGLNLYQCLSQVEDGLNELERYTMGYVDNYLNDGREMLREAKQKRLQLQVQHRRLKIS